MEHIYGRKPLASYWPQEKAISRFQKPGPKAFATLWLLFFLLIISISYAAGLAPRGLQMFMRSLSASTIHEADQEPAPPEPVTSSAQASVPVKIESYRDDERLVIPAITIDTKIVFPESREIEDMNTALQSGAVRFPSPTKPGEKGNILLFGHSTGLANVKNKNFAIFNDLKKLEVGDAIMIHAQDREYIYIVSSVAVKNADDAKIELETEKRKLTLSTCNVFGRVEERYVVEANFLGSYPLTIQ